MVKMTMKNTDVFGIDGYNLPVCELKSKGLSFKVPQEKAKGFGEVQANYTKNQPGPGAHKVEFQWAQPEKKQYPTKKNSYIEQIYHLEKKKVSPSEYKPNVKFVQKRTLNGESPKAEGINFLSDVAYQATMGPSPQGLKDTDVLGAKLKTLTKSYSVLSWKT